MDKYAIISSKTDLFYYLFVPLLVRNKCNILIFTVSQQFPDNYFAVFEVFSSLIPKI